MPSCTRVLVNGTQCQMPRLRDSDLCYTHDNRPEIVKRRRAGQQRGGRMRMTPHSASPVTLGLRSPLEVYNVGLVLLERLNNGTIDPRRAGAMIRACKVALEAHQAALLGSEEGKAQAKRPEERQSKRISLRQLDDLISHLRSGR